LPTSSSTTTSSSTKEKEGEPSTPRPMRPMERMKPSSRRTKVVLYFSATAIALRPDFFLPQPQAAENAFFL